MSKKDAPCGGGADAYLGFLLAEILPKAEDVAAGEPCWRGIAGYSLAGLFALYAIHQHQTDIFSRAASISGSLWFPGFRDYVFAHVPKKRPDCLYFSPSDRDALTRNPMLRTVEENAEQIEVCYAAQGIDAVFELNSGNHFKDVVRRTAAGIEWILSR